MDFHINLIGRPEFKRKSKRATVIVFSTTSIKQENGENHAKSFISAKLKHEI